MRQHTAATTMAIIMVNVARWFDHAFITVIYIVDCACKMYTNIRPHQMERRMNASTQRRLFLFQQKPQTTTKYCGWELKKSRKSAPKRNSCDGDEITGCLFIVYVLLSEKNERRWKKLPTNSKTFTVLWFYQRQQHTHTYTATIAWHFVSLVGLANRDCEWILCLFVNYDGFISNH